jgi:HEPN domain-containing protein
MDKVIKNWLASSRYDIKTAEAIYKSKRYVYVIFMCHLSIEKALKHRQIN